MNPLSVAVLLIFSTILVSVRRDRVPLILILACCYTTVGAKISIAGANFPLFRFLIVVGILRAIILSEYSALPKTRVDKLLIAWAAWIFFASFFHEFTPGSGPKYMGGVIIDLCGAYYLFRNYLRTYNEIENFIAAACLIIIPVSIAMTIEQVAYYNLFSIFEGVPEYPLIRDGRIRAQGPFNHPILAGSVGAFLFPLAWSLFKTNKTRSIIGMGASTLMVLSSASSGPVMSLLFAILALGFWRYRQHTPKLVWGGVFSYLFLMVAMNQAPYYLISRINVTGSSTGWHRAYLIDRTIHYFNEWWLFGTDRTRHWMPEQGFISNEHTDVTNYFIAFAVNGGLLSLVLIVLIVWYSAKTLWKLSITSTLDHSKQCFIWCIGAAAFANAMTSISVAFFGQAQVFFWLPIALISVLSPLLRPEPLSNPVSPK